MGFRHKKVSHYIKLRKAEVIQVQLEVLGENPNGIDLHDRFRAYDKLEEKTKNRPHQYRWFHILADSKELPETCGEEGEFIHKGLKAVFAEANKFEHTGTQLDVETPE